MAERHSKGRDRFTPQTLGLRATAIHGLRNGLADVRPYHWNLAGQEREREVAAKLAALRAQIAARAEAEAGHA